MRFAVSFSAQQQAALLLVLLSSSSSSSHRVRPAAAFVVPDSFSTANTAAALRRHRPRQRFLQGQQRRPQQQPRRSTTDAERLLVLSASYLDELSNGDPQPSFQPQSQEEGATSAASLSSSPSYTSYLDQLDSAPQDRPAAESIGANDDAPIHSIPGVDDAESYIPSAPSAEYLTDSYWDTISEECSGDAPSLKCKHSITSYLEALSKGEVEPSITPAAAIASYIASLSPDGTPATAGMAVASYIDSLSKGAVQAPSSMAVSRYLDGVFSGMVRVPSSENEIREGLESIAAAGVGPCKGGTKLVSYLDTMDQQKHAGAAAAEAEATAASAGGKEGKEEKVEEGTLSAKEIEEMTEAFNMFDADGNGVISLDELKRVMSKMGWDLSMEELFDMVATVDEDQNGEIDFDEFKVMMQSAKGNADDGSRERTKTEENLIMFARGADSIVSPDVANSRALVELLRESKRKPSAVQKTLTSLSSSEGIGQEHVDHYGEAMGRRNFLGVGLILSGVGVLVAGGVKFEGTPVIVEEAEGEGGGGAASTATEFTPPASSTPASTEGPPAAGTLKDDGKVKPSTGAEPRAAAPTKPFAGKTRPVIVEKDGKLTIVREPVGGVGVDKKPKEAATVPVADKKPKESATVPEAAKPKAVMPEDAQPETFYDEEGDEFTLDGEELLDELPSAPGAEPKSEAKKKPAAVEAAKKPAAEPEASRSLKEVVEEANKAAAPAAVKEAKPEPVAAEVVMPEPPVMPDFKSAAEFSAERREPFGFNKPKEATTAAGAGARAAPKAEPAKVQSKEPELLPKPITSSIYSERH